MPPPAAPPARPHSAHPHRALPTALFRTSSSPRRPASADGRAPPGIGSGSAGTSASALLVSGTGRHGRLLRDADWEDAWDSSSDKEDDVAAMPPAGPSVSASTTTAKAKPIPISARHASPPASGGAGGSGSISTSWVSASFHPTPPQGTPPGPASGASAGSASSHYVPGASSAAPSTRAVANKAATGSGSAAGTTLSSPTKPQAQPTTQKLTPTRLPPGGAWEIVETTDASEPAAPELPRGVEAIRPDADDVLRDPMHLLAALSLSAPTSPAITGSEPVTPGSPGGTPLGVRWGGGIGASVERKRSVRTERRRERFVRILNCEKNGTVNVGELKKIAWNGVPQEVRPIVWQLLLNYMPLALQPRLTTLNRKRKEYRQLVDQYFSRGTAALDQQIWHQIKIDVPRTRPGTPLWSCPSTQRALERILYVWAIRHPASGYVQGINDLATPFFEVFLSAYVSVDPENFDVGHLPPDVLDAVEADSFWCLTKLLDGIQDHYISQQPGIQRLVRRMGDLVKRIDPALAAHFDDQGVEYMQFAFRWMNCLLMREITVKCTIRMWDTYLSEGADAFSQFHLYVCCALLVKFSDRLREMDFQEIIMFLQRLPTMTWTDHDIELLLSEAFVLKNVWHGAENHFAGANGTGPGVGMMGR